MSRDQERIKQPLPAGAPRQEERQRFRWLDFLRGPEGRKGPAGEERERLRSHVAHASKILPPKGPIHAFVAQNPLQGLEELPFDQAVRKAQRLLGGQGYLSNEAFRRIYADGRITRDDLLGALEAQVPHLLSRPPIRVRGRSVEARDVCLAYLLHQIDPLPHGALRWQLSQGKATKRFRHDVPPETRQQLLHRTWHDLQVGGSPSGGERQGERGLEAYAVSSLWAAVLATLGLGDPLALEGLETQVTEALLRRIFEVARDGLSERDQRADLRRTAYEALERDIKRIGPEWTLGDFCQRMTGARITETINDQMVRWCAAFLDEGLAGWPMPHRERGFYEAWRKLAERDLTCWFLGIRDSRKKVRQLPSHPEDAAIQSLRTMGIPEKYWTEYFTLHLAALPGWAGLVRWRETHPLYGMQQRYPIDLIQYLAVRLFYEVELVSSLCRKEWEIEGTVPALHTYFRAHPGEHFARSQIAAGDLPDTLVSGVVRTSQGTIALNWDAFTHPSYGEMGRAKGLSRSEEWFRFAEMLYVCRKGGGTGHHTLEAVCTHAWRLFHLAQLLGLSAEDIRALSMDEAKTLLTLLDDLPPAAHGPIWLEAYETHYRGQLLTLLSGDREPSSRGDRPRAQIVFCLDMREEGIRRHVEAQSNAYETFGTAGFFHMPMIFRPLATGIAKPSCPIPIDPRHTVAEEVHSGHDTMEARHEYRKKWKEALHGIYHRLETNFATAYALIDLLGVPFGITVTGRTLLPQRWRTATATLREGLVPPVRTSLHVDRPTEDEARERLAARDRDRILEIVLARTRRKHLRDGLSREAIEELRMVVLGERPSDGQTQVARLLNLSRAEELALMEELRQNGLDPRHRAAQLAEFHTMGFSLEEQVDLVEAQLRMIGLTRNFARLVLFCGHGSTTENNPYAAAYHCGACGGNRGGPNGRAIAAMLNSPKVRASLAQRGILIPEDTHFLGAEHDTAADRFTYFDVEDLPPAHREEFRRLAHDLRQACGQHAQERCRQLPRAPEHPTPEEALRHVQTRSVDWAQVYPEWGHARCAVMLIGRRDLTRGLPLDRRVYLQSYDPDQDPEGTILAEIMAAFIPVVRGIALDYYFSSIDSGINGVFGAGTKAIHNVVGLIGVMQGAGGDLKPGLPAQGVVPLHEPMRAHLLIEAHPARVSSITERYKVLKDLFDNQWAHLMVWVPGTREFMRYQPGGRWEALSAPLPSAPAPSSAPSTLRRDGRCQ